PSSAWPWPPCWPRPPPAGDARAGCSGRHRPRRRSNAVRSHGRHRRRRAAPRPRNHPPGRRRVGDRLRDDVRGLRRRCAAAGRRVGRPSRPAPGGPAPRRRVVLRHRDDEQQLLVPARGDGARDGHRGARRPRGQVPAVGHLRGRAGNFVPAHPDGSQRVAAVPRGPRMEVQYNERKGCVWVAGAVFSLGLLSLLNRRADRQAPVRLTEDEMVLRNGRRIPWSTFNRVTATDVYLGSGLSKRYVRTVYALKYPEGTIRLATDYLRDADRVVDFVLSHVPPEARQA